MSNNMPNNVWDEITYRFTKYGVDEKFHPSLCNSCDYISMLELIEIIPY